MAEEKKPEEKSNVKWTHGHTRAARHIPEPINHLARQREEGYAAAEKLKDGGPPPKNRGRRI